MRKRLDVEKSLKKRQTIPTLVSDEKAKADKETPFWLQEYIRFAEASACVEAFGFKLERVKGSHHIFVHPEVPELINLPDVAGKAKPYQIKQLLKIVERYNLQIEDKE